MLFHSRSESSRMNSDNPMSRRRQACVDIASSVDCFDPGTATCATTQPASKPLTIPVSALANQETGTSDGSVQVGIGKTYTNNLSPGLQTTVRGRRGFWPSPRSHARGNPGQHVGRRSSQILGHACGPLPRHDRRCGGLGIPLGALGRSVLKTVSLVGEWHIRHLVATAQQDSNTKFDELGFSLATE